MTGNINSLNSNILFHKNFKKNRRGLLLNFVQNYKSDNSKGYLVSKGIAVTRLTSDGFGSAKPIASNKTTAGKTQNRRVEIKLAK